MPMVNEVQKIHEFLYDQELLGAVHENFANRFLDLAGQFLLVMYEVPRVIKRLEAHKVILTFG